MITKLLGASNLPDAIIESVKSIIRGWFLNEILLNLKSGLVAICRSIFAKAEASLYLGGRETLFPFGRLSIQLSPKPHLGTALAEQQPISGG